MPAISQRCCLERCVDNNDVHPVGWCDGDGLYQSSDHRLSGLGRRPRRVDGAPALTPTHRRGRPAWVSQTGRSVKVPTKRGRKRTGFVGGAAANPVASRGRGDGAEARAPARARLRRGWCCGRTRVWPDQRAALRARNCPKAAGGAP